MNDLEHDVRNTLRRHESDVPLLDWSDARPVARRVRRRQVLNVVAVATLAVGIVAGSLVGIGVLVRSDEGTPAQPTTLAPPAEAPFAVGSGTAEGWRWLLSASADGTCVALTDEQGSSTSCATEPEPGFTAHWEDALDIVDVAVRSPRSPAPPLVFVFGRVSSRVATVNRSLHLFVVEEPPAELFPAPNGVGADDGYYVTWLAGYPHPIVPDITLLALGRDGDFVDMALVERPLWAKPEYTELVTIAHGVWRRKGWQIGVYRSEVTGLLCLSDKPATAACGAASDPSVEWFPSWGRFRLLSTLSCCDDELRSTFAWGVFRDPVASVRVDLDDGRTFEPDMYDLPSGYPQDFHVFVLQYEGEVGGWVRAIDGDGSVTDRARRIPPR